MREQWGMGNIKGPGLVTLTLVVGNCSPLAYPEGRVHGPISPAGIVAGGMLCSTQL